MNSEQPTHTHTHQNEFPFIFTKNYFCEWEKNVSQFFNYVLPQQNAQSTQINMLVVGAYQGQSTIWFIKNILTCPLSTCEVVDTFLGTSTQTDIECRHMYELFLHNTLQYKEKVKVNKKSIEQFYREYIAKKEEVKKVGENIIKYDYIYVDAELGDKDGLKNAIYVAEFIKNGGYLIFTNYLPVLLEETQNEKDDTHKRMEQDRYDYTCNGVIITNDKNENRMFTYKKNVFRAMNIFMDIWKDEFEIIMQTNILVLRKRKYSLEK